MVSNVWFTIGGATVTTDATVDPSGNPRYDVAYTTSWSGIGNYYLLIPGQTYTTSTFVSGNVNFRFVVRDGSDPNDATDQASASFTPTGTPTLHSYTFVAVSPSRTVVEADFAYIAPYTYRNQIVDSNHDIWTLVPAVSGKGIAKNGVYQAGSQDLLFLLYYNGVMYQNTLSGWYIWNGTIWNASADPRPPYPAPAMGSLGSTVLLVNGLQADGFHPGGINTYLEYKIEAGSSATPYTPNPNIVPSNLATNPWDSFGGASVSLAGNDAVGIPGYNVTFPSTYSGIDIIYPFTPDVTHTISCVVSGSVPFGFNFTDGSNPNDGFDQPSAIFTPTLTPTRFIYTFVPSAPAIGGTGNQLTIYNGAPTASSYTAGTNLFSRFKIETGSYFSGFVPLSILTPSPAPRPPSPTPTPSPNPPLVVNNNNLYDCTQYNTNSWETVGPVSFSDSGILNPIAGFATAQQLNFTTLQTGVWQPNFSLLPNTPYDFSVYAQAISGNPRFCLGVGNSNANTNSFGSLHIPPTGFWQRYDFSFTSGVVGPTTITDQFFIVNSSTMGDTNAFPGSVAFYAALVSLGSIPVTWTGCSAPFITGDNINGSINLTASTAQAIIIDATFYASGLITAAQLVTLPINGIASIVSQTSVSYMSDAGFVGVDTFTFNVVDASGAISNTVTVNITVGSASTNLLKCPNNYSTTSWTLSGGAILGTAGAPIPTIAPTLISFPSLTHTESPNGTLIPPASRITDANTNVWTITRSAQIASNGFVDPVVTNVSIIAYFNHRVYQQSSGNWYFWSGISWVSTVDPRP